LGGLSEFWIPLKNAPTKIERRENMGLSGTLNVILHGTIVYQRIRDIQNRITSIHALIPQFDDHTVRAGNWLAETTLRPGEYTLRGAQDKALSPEYNFPDSRENLVFPGSIRADLQPGIGDLYARIILGRPNSVTTLRRAKVERRNFAGSASTLLNDEGQIANIQVFTYHFDDDAALSLEKHLWEPVFSGKGNNGGEDKTTINLHVIAEHELTANDGEFTSSFDACVRLFELNGAPLNLTFKPPGPPFTEKGNRPDGVSLEEMEGLASRTRRLERLGRLQKDHAPALINQLWFDFNPSDPDVVACGGGKDGP
jgi:hypothetical protein